MNLHQHAASREVRIEDLTWMAETGENAEGAAKRLGLTDAALEKWAKRHMPDTWAILLARNPASYGGRGSNQWSAA